MDSYKARTQDSRRAALVQIVHQKRLNRQI